MNFGRLKEEINALLRDLVIRRKRNKSKRIKYEDERDYYEMDISKILMQTLQCQR